jgi:hypothetical protein
MKKLLFVVAVATIGLTTSCTKDCIACKAKATTVSGGTISNGKSAEECKALKATADASKGTIEYTCD